MTAFRHAKYIRAAVESCLEQTLQSLEVIVVDDGSDDETVEILHRFRDSRLIVVPQQNAGPSLAANRAVAMARGSYIALMSGDDVCLPNRLESQLTELSGENLDAIFGRPVLIDETGLPLPDSRALGFFRKPPTSSSDLLRALFFECNFLCAPGGMIRKAAFVDCGMFHPALYQLQDFDMWLRLCQKHRVRLSEDRVVNYRIRDRQGNLSSSINQRRIEVELDFVYRSFLRDLDSDTLRMAFKADLELWDLEHAGIEDQRILVSLLHPMPNVRRQGFELLIDRFSYLQQQDAVGYAGLNLRARDLASILLVNA